MQFYVNIYKTVKRKTWNHREVYLVHLKIDIVDRDIFNGMVKLFGYGKLGIRIVIEAKDRVSLLADITKIIKDLHIIIRAVVTVEKDDQKVDVVLRLGIVDPAPLVKAPEDN